MTDHVREIVAVAVGDWFNDFSRCHHGPDGEGRERPMRNECAICLVDTVMSALDERCWPIEPREWKP